MKRTVLALSLCLGVRAGAQGLESWHSTDLPLAHFRSVDLSLHTQARLGSEPHSWSYLRLGPYLTFFHRPWLRWTAGAWHHESSRKADEWEGSNRVYGGPELRWVNRGVQLWSRHYAERFWYPASRADDRFRHRHRLQAGWEGRWEPRFSYEWVLDSQGIQLVRPSAGFQAFSNSHASFTVTYLYDFRRASLGGNRHAILTALRFRLGRER